MKLHLEHVLSHFGRRRPNESRVNARIESKGWKNNVPSAARIITKWKPSGPIEIAMDSEHIEQLIYSQRWQGLTVMSTLEQGKRVIATRDFQPGEVVCDYHGRVVTAKEGRTIHKTTRLLFYKNCKGISMCIDAHLPKRDCHLEKETFGRLINHSRNHLNLRHRAYRMNYNGEVKDVILFIASKSISVNDELLFDYSVQRKSFNGECLKLCWF
ncbi:N-lysine methyltransferase KMT5A-A [Bagarius yarrelli]|uniref:N-lysine methyltransferase KMT5A-A n=1 Tax=Bagarius yarrelli TaxID=175774 RepID=A0A556VAV3_BAGYA|nr:N-lysine methyltransferase KMT5A-A [Bagarius yarrelli]